MYIRNSDNKDDNFDNSNKIVIIEENNNYITESQETLLKNVKTSVNLDIPEETSDRQGFWNVGFLQFKNVSCCQIFSILNTIFQSSSHCFFWAAKKPQKPDFEKSGLSLETAKNENTKKKNDQDNNIKKTKKPEQVKIGVHNIVKEGFKILGHFVDKDSKNFQAFNEMIDIWNPESSKWAVQASKKYKIALERRRQSRPKDWFDEPDKDRRIKRKVEIEHCGCQREILGK